MSSSNPVAFRLRPVTLAVLSALLPGGASAAPVDWLPDADGFWDVVANWSSAPALPGADDQAILDVGGATVRTITHRSGNTVLFSLLSEENFVLQNGTLTLNEASTINGSYTQQGGTLAGLGFLTVNGTSTIQGGTMTGLAATILRGNTTVSGSLSLDEGRLLRNEATLTWTGGTLQLNPASNSGAGRIDNTGVFEAQGNNAISATNFTDLNAIFGAPAFNNSGEFRKRIGTGTTTVDVAFNNTGTVDVQSGTLNLAGGGVSSGDFDATGATLQFGGGTHSLAASSDITASNLAVSSGELTHAGLYDVTGTTRVSGGILNLNGTVQSLGTTLDIAGGTLNLGSTSATVSTLTLSGGALSGTGSLTVGTSTTLSGGTLTGAGTTLLSGATTINGAVNIDAGRILRNEGTVTWTGGNLQLNPSFNTGAGRIDNASVFEAQGNNTLAATAFSDLGALAGFPAFNNSGEFRKRIGTGVTAIDVAFNNTGTVDVQSGTLNLGGGGVSSGDFDATGATLQFGGGTHNLSASSDLTASNVIVSAGEVTHAGLYNVTDTTRVNGGVFNLNGSVQSLGTTLALGGGRLNLGGTPVSVATLSLLNGTVSGTGTISVSSTATLGSGQIVGAGTTTLADTTTTTINGSFGLDDGRILRNEGTVNWLGGNLLLNVTNNGGSGRIDNALGALFDARGSNSMSATAFGDLNTLAGFPAFNNAGRFLKSEGASTTSIEVAFNNTGTVDVDVGTLNLSGGGTSSGDFDATGATLQFGGGTHILAASSDIVATTLRVSGGTLTHDGSLDVLGTTTISGGTANLRGAIASLGSALTMSSGTLNLESSSASVASLSQLGATIGGSGVLTVTGTASLAGSSMVGSGTTVLQGSSTQDGALNLDSGRTLRNEGSYAWNAGSVNMNQTSTGGSGRIVNAAGGVFETLGNNSMDATAFSDLATLPGFPAFDNAGTFRKRQGTGATRLDVAFNNTGSVEVQTGTLNLSAGGTTATIATISVLEGATLQFGGGTHGIANLANVSNSGRLLVSAGSVTTAGALDSAGLLEITSGSLSLADDGVTQRYSQAGGVLDGAGDLTVVDTATLTSTSMRGTGTTTLQGATTVSGQLALDSGRILRNEGSLLWTAGGINLNGSGANGGSGRLDNADGAVFEIRGSGGMEATPFGDLNDRAGFPAFNNAGVLRKNVNAGPTNISVAYDNTGSTEVELGSLVFSGAVAQHSGSVLTGGTWRVSGSGALNFTVGGAQNITENRGDVTLDGAAASFTRINTLTNNQGAFRLLGGRNFGATGAFTNGGVLELGGGSFNAPSLTNLAGGEIVGVGTITPTVRNSGLVRAAGGRLSAAGGIDGQSGTLQSDAGATLALGANSDGDFLVNNGTLDLGASNVTVAVDYTNANFGSGNAFDARANVLGSGQIRAAGDVAQGIDGDVIDGNAAVARMNFGNLHLGATINREYRIANLGSTGPALRGAIQTSANGGNLTDTRLSGSGVTAGDFGPVAAGTNSGAFDVSFTGSSVGALSGQRVALVNNFDNVAGQVLDIDGAVFRLAAGAVTTPQPIDLGAYRVGDASASVGLAIANLAAADGFSERLDAGVSSNAAGFTATGSVSLLGAGATNTGGIAVGIDTTTAGTKSGSTTIAYTSNGSGTSGLGLTAAGTQAVALAGRVYAEAIANVQTPSIDFGIVHVGDTVVARGISVRNDANGALNDTLRGSVSTTADGFTASGTLGAAGLGAGATSTALRIGLNTTTAGVFSGQAQLDFASHNDELADLDLGVTSVNLLGQVNNFANPVFTQATGSGNFSANGNRFLLDFGQLTQGSLAVSGELALTNLVSGPADLLATEFSVGAGPFALGGFGNLLHGAGAGQTLSVSFDPLAVGLFEQSITIALFGQNASGFRGSLGSFELTLRADVAPVPVPAAAWLFGTGLIALATRRRSRA